MESSLGGEMYGPYNGCAGSFAVIEGSNAKGFHDDGQRLSSMETQSRKSHGLMVLNTKHSRFDFGYCMVDANELCTELFRFYRLFAMRSGFLSL